MEEHLDEPLTIPALSRRACLSATTFKEGFRQLYGLPVHTWLRKQRMERAGATAAYARIKPGRSGKSGGVQQCQSICRRFPATIWG